MNQPELGIKIVELRNTKGLTQEDLAAECNLNVRSIQRIEKGEVVPRAYTLNILSNVLEFDLRISNDVSENERKLWLLCLHISNFLPIVLIPLLIWLIKKEDIPEMDKHAKDVLNFQISMCIYLFVSAMLVFIIIGVLILICLGIFIGIITIINCVKVAMDKSYYYPFTIKIID